MSEDEPKTFLRLTKTERRMRIAYLFKKGRSMRDLAVEFKLSLSEIENYVRSYMGSDERFEDVEDVEDECNLTKLFLNLRVQSLLIQYISHRDGIEPAEVVEVFTNKAQDVFDLSSSEINNHVADVEQALEECIKTECRGMVKIDLN